MTWGHFLSKYRLQCLRNAKYFSAPSEIEALFRFFFLAVVFHEDQKSTSAETVAGYKPFGFVPSPFIKVTRQTYSQISLRIHYGRREECRPTKDSSCLKKLYSFSLPTIHMLRGLQLCSGYRLRAITDLCQFLQPSGCNKTTGSNRTVLGGFIHLCCQNHCKYPAELPKHNSPVIITTMLHVSGIAAIGVAKCLKNVKRR